LQSVHVQLMKKYNKQENTLTVGRATSVFEPDSTRDDITDRYAEVKVTGDKLSDKQQSGIDKLMDKHKQMLTKEPDLTHLTTFAIDTGTHSPIYQRAYNTPASLRESIDKEIELLLKKGFIRRSQSPWASPMVTVKKL